MKRPNSGFGTIAVIMILVILGGLSAAIVSLSTGQQLGSARDVLSAQAWQLALAGSRGGITRAMAAGACGTETWTSPDYPAFRVTTVCSAASYNDGETTAGTARVLRVFRIEATACNGAAATCPDNASAAALGYVERQRVAVAYCEWDGAACTGP